MRYSVVIVTYQRHAPLCDTIRVLAPHLDPNAGELVVVDQRPRGLLPADVMATPGLRYFATSRPGMVEARNSGIRLARGRVVIFLDDDVIPLPGLIDGHLDAYADTSVGGVAGRILEPGQKSPAPLDPRALDPVRGWEFAQFDSTVLGDAMTVRGCNMSYQRDVLIRLGGFDTAYTPPYSFREDSDMSFRVRQAGYKLRFCPTAALVHLNAPSGGTRHTTVPSAGVQIEWKRVRSLYQHQLNNLYFLMRHFRGQARWAGIARAYCSYVGLSRWPWRLAAKNAAFALAMWRAAALARYRQYHPCTLSEGGDR